MLTFPCKMLKFSRYFKTTHNKNGKISVVDNTKLLCFKYTRINNEVNV